MTVAVKLNISICFITSLINTVFLEKIVLNQIFLVKTPVELYNEIQGLKSLGN